jgi:hypothetical protein
MWDLLVVQRYRDVHLVYQATQASAQDDTGMWRAVPFGTDHVGRFFDLIKQF